MKRFLASIAFCVLLLLVGLIAFSPGSRADGDLARKLIDLPAPPPPNPFFKPDQTVRKADFYDLNKPPSDEAPIEDLMDYWLQQNQRDRSRNYTIKPTDKALERMMSELSDDPERLTQYLNVFAENEDGIEFVKRLYDSELINRKFEKEWRETVKHWLVYNSPYFGSELLRLAQGAKDENEYVTNQDEVLALAKVDWNLAEPLLNKLVNDGSQPVSQTLARWGYYQHALDTKDESEAAKWRDQLKAVVENKNAKPGDRDLAMDALVRGGDFEGRDEWYMKLLEDETLHDLRVNGQTYTGLTTIVNHSPEGKYNARMVELLQSDSKTIRSAAIRNLANSGGIKGEAAVRLMLPWLADPNWANDVASSRRALINALKELYIPESVPGLIAVLAERNARNATALGNRAANSAALANPTANTNSLDPSDFQAFQNQFEYRSFLVDTATALGNQRDARAVPALRSVLNELESWQRQSVVRAILQCGGFSAFEQVDAVEYVARGNAERDAAIRQAVNSNTSNTSTDELMPKAALTNSRLDDTPLVTDAEEIKSLLGAALYQYDNPGEDVVSALINRIETLEKKEPAVASQMRDILRGWRGVAVNAVLLRGLKNGTGELSDALKVLARRAEIREKQINDIYDMRGGLPFAAGLAACLLEQNSEYDAAVGGYDVEIKIAVLGCARLIRAKLPLRAVAELMNSENQTLSFAAEQYLESEDSVESRRYVLARHPNEAKVLGARTTFAGKGPFVDSLYEVFGSVNDSESAGAGFGVKFEELEKTEAKLRKEILENNELLGVYAYDKNFVRMYRDKAVFSWEEDPARFRERTLQPNEFERLTSFLAESRVDELPPFLSLCGEYCDNSKELLMLGKSGGRRVFLLGYTIPPFFKQLDAIFKDFKRPRAKLQYYMQRLVPGLEIIFEDEQLAALAVWKNGPDLRVLTDNTIKREQIEKELNAQDQADEENETLDYEQYQEKRRKRRELRAFENLAWFRFGGGRPIAPAQQPADFSFIPTRDRLSVQPDQMQWKTRTASVEIRANGEGLYKVVRGQMTRLRAGFYESPVITPNGRWVIVKKYGTGESEEEDAYGATVVRVNLATGKEFRVDYQGYPPLQPIAFVPGQNRVLLGTAYSYSEEEYEGESAVPEVTYQKLYWLSPENGLLLEAQGNVSAPSQQTFRPLQAVAGKPDEFWVAIRNSDKNQTEIGTYNPRSLAFKPMLTLPQIEFDSMRMWVDEAEQKVYFAYAGHLLSVPMK